MAKEEKKESDEVVDSYEKQKGLEELRQMTSKGPGCDSQQLTEDASVLRILTQWEGHKNFKRVKAFQALQGERVYQESLHKKTGQDPISVPGELALLQVYLTKALIAYADTFGDPGEKPTMDVIRKITAIGLRALENYGCPLRDVEGSLAARPPEHRRHTVPSGKTGIYIGGEIHDEHYLRTTLHKALDKYNEFKVLEKQIVAYKNILRGVPEAVAKLDIRFARAQQELLKDITTPSTDADLAEEPTSPPVEESSEADVGKEINEAGFHEVD